MPKTVIFTTITPLPSGITRQSVLEMYHDHLAMIDLNPLVVERFKCKPPSYAPTDEYWSTWYTIKDKVSYLPGGLAQGSVSYHACFNDLPDGLHTHVYAPLGLDIQAKWSVGGRLPGEPRLPLAESGLNVPAHGLYIREDVKMTCSSLLLSFVKKTFKDSHAGLVEKLVERAHVLESNFANERLQALRNVDPGERMGHGDIFIAPPPGYQPSALVSPVTSPRFVSHTRSHSDPIISPGFSSSSTLVDRSDSLSSPNQHGNRTASFELHFEGKQVSTSAPQQSSFLLPATTYDGGFSSRSQRPISLHPGSQSDQHSHRGISPSPTNSRSTEKAFASRPPRVSYTPEEHPIMFTMPFDPKSPFDKKSSSEVGNSKGSNILEDIDVAIDEVFMYTLPSTTYATLPAATLPATTYSPGTTAANKKYDARHGRKDSVMPSDLYLDKELPPVPLKDEKYRRAL